MNAITSIEPSKGDISWDKASRSANAWRGEALQCFAQAERAVSETLVTLAKVPKRGAAVRLELLVGQRFQTLHNAVAVGGPFEPEGAPVLTALLAFRAHESLRPFLCHGVGNIALDRQHRWILMLKLLVLRAGEARHDAFAIDQCDAETMLTDLKAAGHKLRCALGTLRAAFR